MYPHIHRYSIGWRMGYGESYCGIFWDWFNLLTDYDREMYKEMFPEPRAWRGIYNDDDENSEVDDFIFNGVELWNAGGEQQYSREKSIAEYNKNGELEFVFFGQPENGVINESCLGQWYLTKFFDGVDEYCCTEQYMMAEKARLFEDDEICTAIIETKNPKEMKALGKKVKNFDQTTWDKGKYSIVLNGNYLKFSQNENLRNYLLSTENKILVEASPLDTIWGIELGKDKEKAYNPNTWKGENLLGFALVEVRDEIRNVYKNYYTINWNDINVDWG